MKAGRKKKRRTTSSRKKKKGQKGKQANATTRKVITLEDRIGPGIIGRGLIDPDLDEVNEVLELETPLDVVQSNDPFHTDKSEEFPTPPYVDKGPDWIQENPDRSVSLEIPQYVDLDEESHVARMSTNFFHQEFDALIPKNIRFHEDGTLSFELPKSAKVDAQKRTVTVLEADAPFLEDIPPIFNAHLCEGKIVATLPPGVEYHKELHSLNFDNYHANLIIHYDRFGVNLNLDGTITIDLPLDAVFHDDGSILIPDEYANFVKQPVPSYCHDGPEWIEFEPEDGTILIAAPPEFKVDPEKKTISMSVEDATEFFPVPEEFFLQYDGTIEITLPEGTNFLEGKLTFAPGLLGAGELPAGTEAVMCPQGNLTVSLPQGIECDEDHNLLILNNEHSNNFLPKPLELTPEGLLVVHLPDDTKFHDDGSLTVSSDSADFLDRADHGPFGSQLGFNPAALIRISLEGREAAVYDNYEGVFKKSQ